MCIGLWITWELRAGFSQRSGFLPSELWTLRNLTVWGSSLTNDPTLQTNLQGVLLAYTGQARRSWLKGNHHFTFRVTPAQPDYRLTVVKASPTRRLGIEVEDAVESKPDFVADWVAG